MLKPYQLRSEPSGKGKVVEYAVGAATGNKPSGTDLMWRELAQRYAIRAREFSDAVAALGREAHLGPEASREAVNEVRRRRDLCNEAADEFERYLKLNACAMDSDR
jgi:hypothetical protein